MLRTKNRKADEEAGNAGERILATAADLFYRKGIRAVGVEEIVQEAGVAKISLYRHFGSKDELIVAYLEARNTGFWNEWDQAFARYEGNPKAQLDAIMTYLARRTTQPGYRGCPFINYASEFPDPLHAGHRVVEANKREWRRRLGRIAEGLNSSQATQLADGLLLLVEGVYAVSQTLSGPKGPGAMIVSAARALVQGQSRRARASK